MIITLMSIVNGWLQLDGVNQHNTSPTQWCYSTSWSPGVTGVHISAHYFGCKICEKKWQILRMFTIISGVGRVHASAQPQFLLPKELGLPYTSIWSVLLQSRNMVCFLFSVYLTNGPVCFLQQGGLNNWNKHSVFRSLPPTDGQGPLQATYAELLLRLSLR